MDYSYLPKTVNVLGTDYELRVEKVSENKELRERQLVGVCMYLPRVIVIGDVNEEETFHLSNDTEKQRYFNETLRHELIHAFLTESGLKDSALVVEGAWATNEEMVDWFAIQAPKIFKLYKECNCL